MTVTCPVSEGFVRLQLVPMGAMCLCGMPSCSASGLCLLVATVATRGFSREEREERRPDARFYEAHRPEKLTERDFIDFICNVGSQDTPCFELGSAVSPRFTRAAKLNWMRCVLV